MGGRKWNRLGHCFCRASEPRVRRVNTDAAFRTFASLIRLKRDCQQGYSKRKREKGTTCLCRRFLRQLPCHRFETSMKNVTRAKNADI